MNQCQQFAQWERWIKPAIHRKHPRPIVQPQQRAAAVLSLAAFFGLGCGDGAGGAAATPIGAGLDAGPRPDAGAPATSVMDAGARELAAPPRTYAPTLQAIQTEIFRPTCAAVFCHKDDRLGFDASSLERSYETLVNVPSDTELCGPTGLVRVAPGDPSQSLLYLKLTDPPCGRPMPLLFDASLDPRDLMQIRQWIEDGASAE